MPTRLYVISDLHIGGEYPDPTDASARGFRLCTQVDALVRFVRSLAASDNAVGHDIELVINGDFVDFLAEKADSGARSTRSDWQPFILDAHEASLIFERIVRRDKALFSALRDFLAGGHHLSVVLGNHDIELSLPSLRQVLVEELDADHKRFSFVYDGEAYRVGKVLIEHGNRYDEWNVVSHDALRRVRSVQSRMEPPLDSSRSFEPPAGSFLVAGVMNEIKSRYPFIDLLKPESTAAIPILLALAPEYRTKILKIAELVARTRMHTVGRDGIPSNSGDIAEIGSSDATASPAESLVRGILRKKLPDGTFNSFVASTLDTPAIEAHEIDRDLGDVGSSELRSLWSTITLLLARHSEPVSKRLPVLLAALEGTRADFSFDRHQEIEPYRSAAERLLSRGFQVVVFGHTHLAKNVSLAGGTYLNTGTWADLLPFPATILDDSVSASMDHSKDASLNRLKAFVEDMATARLRKYIRFMPTYAQIELDDHGEVTSARLCDYDWQQKA